MFNKTIARFIVAILNLCCIAPFATATPPQVWVDDDAQIGYRVTLWKDGDPAQKTVIQGTIDEITNGAYVAPGVTLYVSHWSGSPGLSFLNEEVWAIQALADSGPGMGVYEVEFPILKLNQLTAFPNKDRLLVPHGPGRAIVNPWNVTPTKQGGKPRQQLGIWYGIYGDSSQSMQFIVYDDGNPDSTQTRGMMFRTADSDYHLKDFHVSKMGANDIFPQGTVYASVHHFPDNAGQVGTSFTGTNQPEYLIYTDCYEGGWEQTVRERYRYWAIAQNWAAKGRILDRIASGNLPDWYKNNVMWVTVFGSATDENYLNNNIRPAFSNIETGVFCTQWQRWPFDTFNPDYFPSKHPTTFQNLLNMQSNASASQSGIHLFPYINVQLIDTSYNYPIATGADSTKVTLFNNLIAASRIKGPNGIIPNPASIPGWNSYGNPMPGTTLSDSYFDPIEFWGRHERFFDLVTGQWTGEGLTEKFQDSLLAVQKKAWGHTDVQNLVSPTQSVSNATGPGLYAPEFFDHKYKRDGIFNYLQSTWRANPDANGNYITLGEIENPIIVSRRGFAPLCRGAQGWHSYFLDKSNSILSGYGADGIYLDQFDSNGTSYLCFSSTHTLVGGTPHPKGWGTYRAKGSRKLANDIATNNTGKILFAEHVSESTVDVIQEHYMGYPQKAAHIVVPLFATVYQGYTSFHQWAIPDSVVTSANRADFMDAVAYAIYMGYKLGGGMSPGQSYFDSNVNAIAALDYLKTAASMLQQNLMDSVTYGQRFSDPQFMSTIPTQTVTRYGFYGDSASVQVPAIRGSCWKGYGSLGKKVLLLSNVSSAPISVRVKTPLFAGGTTLTDKALNAAGNPTNLTYTYSQQNGVTVTVPSDGWIALVGGDVSAAVINLTLGGADVEGSGADQNIAGGWAAVTGTGSFQLRNNGIGGVLHSGPTRLRQGGSGGNAASLVIAVEQAIDISAYAADIDAGNVTTDFSSWGFSRQVNDSAFMRLDFLDASDAVIGSSATVSIGDDSRVWTELLITGEAIPTLTRKINVVGGVERLTGNGTDALWDGDVVGSLTIIPDPG